LKICSISRYVARALYDSGVNPSRRKIHESLSDLGDVDSPGISFGSFTLTKATRPESIQQMEYKFPCVLKEESESQNSSGCIIPVTSPKNIFTN